MPTSGMAMVFDPQCIDVRDSLVDLDQAEVGTLIEMLEETSRHGAPLRQALSKKLLEVSRTVQN